MKTQTKLFTLVGIAALLVVALAIGGWFVNTVFAQGPWGGGFMGMGHNNQAVLTLLKTNESDLLLQRPQGKSLLDIASVIGVGEPALTDALLDPMTQMASWMTQHPPQSDVTQMTEWMRQQIAQDLRVAQYGTVTDMHLFGGAVMNGMMSNRNGNNGFGGMMGGNGMMSGMMNGGMMGGWNNSPNVNATPVPFSQKVDRKVNLTAANFKFVPATVTVKAGETVKLTIANQDKFAHNVASQDGKLAYTVLPADQSTSILWVAPNEAGDYPVNCNWHPGMQFTVVVD
jgi:plastocyanin